MGVTADIDRLEAMVVACERAKGRPSPAAVVDTARFAQWQHLLLHPTETPTVGDEPIIGIGLCWNRQRLDPRNYLPFVGVRVGSNPQGAAAGAAFLDGGGLQLREEFHWSGKGEPSWPAYFYLDPFDRWWQQLDVYRAIIVEHVTLGLNRMEGPLRSALEALRR